MPLGLGSPRLPVRSRLEAVVLEAIRAFLDNGIARVARRGPELVDEHVAVPDEARLADELGGGGERRLLGDALREPAGEGIVAKLDGEAFRRRDALEQARGVPAVAPELVLAGGGVALALLGEATVGVPGILGVALAEQAVAGAVDAGESARVVLGEVAPRVVAEELSARLLGHHGEELPDGVVAELRLAASLVEALDELAVPVVAVGGVDADAGGVRAHPGRCAGVGAPASGRTTGSTAGNAAERVVALVDPTASAEAPRRLATKRVGAVLEELGTVEQGTEPFAEHATGHGFAVPKRGTAGRSVAGRVRTGQTNLHFW